MVKKYSSEHQVGLSEKIWSNLHANGVDEAISELRRKVSELLEKANVARNSIADDDGASPAEKVAEEAEKQLPQTSQVVKDVIAKEGAQTLQ